MIGRRPLVVLAVALAIFGALAGRSLFAPSRDNHFTLLADAWLHGRSALSGKPPGWCAAKTERGACVHRFDDFAVLHELTTAEGETLRGYPCVTKDCAEAKRRMGVQRWYVVGRGWIEFSRGQVRRGEETWYVTFPPGPSVAFLPLVAVFGVRLWDVLLTAIAAAAIPAVLVALLDRVRGTADGKAGAHLVAAAALALASPLLWLGSNGRVWFTAQVFAALALLLFVACVLQRRRPALAALCLGFAIACRPINMLPAAIVWIAAWWRDGRDRRAALEFVLVLAAIGALLAGYNWARFQDPLEFGHRFLEIRWQARMQEIGMFSTEYLPRNLRCMLSLLPVRDAVAPWFRVSIHGTALWVGSPWLVAAVFARTRFALRGALWLSAIGAAIPSLLYQNSGQTQVSYRFAVDWLPLVVVALALGGAFDPRPASSWRNPRTWWLPALVLAGAVLQAWGAWNFDRAAGRIFVVRPPGWPFEHELG